MWHPSCLFAVVQTGTLTRNVMEFFKCSIGGVAYGAGITEIERNNAERWVELSSPNRMSVSLGCSSSACFAP